MDKTELYKRRELGNSSHLVETEFNNCFIIYLKDEKAMAAPVASFRRNNDCSFSKSHEIFFFHRSTFHSFVDNSSLYFTSCFLLTSIVRRFQQLVFKNTAYLITARVMMVELSNC